MRQKEEISSKTSQSQVLEQGDIFFFYRPKVRSEEEKVIDDIRRFFIVLAPEDRKLYRLFIMGKKSLPEIRESEARSSEGYWVRVGGIFQRSKGAC